MQGPFLVGGTGRSGTTILTRVLASHAHVTDVPEWRFLIDPDGIIDFLHALELWSPYRYDRALKRLEAVLRAAYTRTFEAKLSDRAQSLVPHRKISPRYSAIDAGAVSPGFEHRSERLLGQLEAFRFDGRWEGMYRLEPSIIRYGAPDEGRIVECLREFLDGVMADVCSTQEATHYLEKNTWNILYLDRIRALLPDARLVHIYRDPRDVVASFTRQTWMPSDPEQCAVIYRDLILRWWDVRERVPADCWMEVSLEELVGDCQRTLDRVYAFMGLDRPPGSGAELSAASLGRWRQDLDASTAERVTTTLAKILEAYGYD